MAVRKAAIFLYEPFYVGRFFVGRFFALPCIAICRSSSASRLNILTILGHCCGVSAIGFDIPGLGSGFGALTGFGGLSDRMPTFGAARLPVVRLVVFIFAPGTCSRGVRSRRAFRHSRMAFEAGATILVQIGVEVRNPDVIAVADLPLLIRSRN